jgi:hypothetical protein
MTWIFQLFKIVIDFSELGYQLDDLIPDITHRLWQRIIDFDVTNSELKSIFKSLLMMRGRAAMKSRSNTTSATSIYQPFPCSFNPPKYAKDWVRFVD